MTILGQMLVEDGIKIGEERGIKLGEQRGLKIGEQKGLKLGEQKGLKLGEQNGLKIGKLEVLLDILSDYGTPDEELLKKIRSESDSNTLSQWIKLAARAGSIQAFEEQIQ